MAGRSMAGWRTTLVMAARQARRAKGRSLLVILLVALPVVVISFAAVGFRTQEVSGDEGITRYMGAAQAQIWNEGSSGRVAQGADPFQGSLAYYGDAGSAGPGGEPGDPAELLGGFRLLPFDRLGSVTVPRGQHDEFVDVRATDLDDPATRGLFELSAGHLPQQAGEIVVNDALIATGIEIGEELAESGLTVVGSGRDASARDYGVGYVLPGTTIKGQEGYAPTRGFLVAGDDAVTWSDVEALNEIGWFVASRAVLSDPSDVVTPADLEEVGMFSEAVEVGGLIALLVLIEVVLLAGPAFAVGARQHSRTIALVALNGGTPAQARRVVMAGAIVLGLVASVVGVVVGIAVAAASMPLLQLLDGAWFGPFDVPWSWVAAIAAFGFASALLSAAVPAWFAARQDVVRVLAGRRGDAQPDPALPILGLGLLVAGVIGASYGAVGTQTGAGTGLLAISIVSAVLGMVLVAPIVVSWVARLAARWPVSARYATRDAARHRSRSVPAVAAVAATVAGVVALGISAASDATENRETYQRSLPDGTFAVKWWSPDPGAEGQQERAEMLESLAQVVDRVRPDAQAQMVTGVLDAPVEGVTTMVHPTAPAGEDGSLARSSQGAFGAEVLVGDQADVLGLPEADQRAVSDALERGEVVVFSDLGAHVSEVDLIVERWPIEPTSSDDAGEESTTVTLPAEVIEVDDVFVRAILPTEVAEGLDLAVGPASLAGAEALTAAEEAELLQALEDVHPDVGLYVERGYERGSDTWVVMVILWGSGLLLMLAGTLTATYLAVGDAKADLATLQAVGAEPRTRRKVAAAYALVISGIGALLGVLVGFVPGVALARSITFADYWGNGVVTGPFVTIPWLLIAAVVIGLPLLAAGIVGLTSRSKLPMVARID